jgi:ribosomal protein S1
MPVMYVDINMIREEPVMTKLSIRAGVTALVLLCALATRGLPTASAQTTSGDTMTATVTFVDPQTGLLWLRNSEGQIIKVAASTKLLDELRKGDRVEVILTKQAAHEATQAPPGDTSTARVREIMKDVGMISLLTDQGEIFTIQPSQGLLAGLQPGDKVTVAVQKISDASSTRSEEQRQAYQQPAQRQQPGQAITATVTSVDTQNNRLTLQQSAHNLVELHVSEQLAATLQSGDTVEVSIRKSPAGRK